MAPVLSKAKLLYKCSLPTCNYYAPNGFFGFPKNEKQRDKWQKLCGMETVKKKDRLCSQHFEESQISNLHTAQPRLKMGAVPSLNLPKVKSKLYIICCNFFLTFLKF